MKETSKKFIENKIKEVMQSMLINKAYFNPIVTKRNAGHVTLCEVDFMPSPDVQKRISKILGEKIIFKERDRIKASIKERKRLNRKGKRKRKRF
jgi:hypothetical protein